MFSIEADIRAPAPGGRRAVVADDDPDQRAALARHLAGRGYTVSEAADGFAALSLIGAESPCLALLRRPAAEDDGDRGGDRAAALACLLYPRTRIILTANAPDPAVGDSPFLVLPRPVDLDLLDRCLDQIGAEVAS
ncbi:response regulator [Azospirillum rugosum]|uniref:CheY-like chemotaxis protein n=1 Tax=Azospirillum rugosum TaxID=416170 RepID=A0ABS4SN88_9PROT|nr:response regulator [Azospirillum rugosum]MBP2294031.1 CheY-like chemotaxis protein [Azospirillum rugosum]MDQ0526782.1 CheY-like chemotaxis protein [Azospirillum rugosum]